MGAPKAGAPLGGTTLLARAVAAAREAGLEVAVVARPGVALPPVDAPVWTEEAGEDPAAPAPHPLRGILTALARAGGRPVVALAVDMPFVAPALLRELAGRPGTAAFRTEGRVQPLPCRVAPGAQAALRAALAGGAGVGAALHAAGAELLEADPAAFLNVNRPDDLARARELLGSRAAP
jgi:molybdopterin-guanine dinucleotide biosynthesis protein A